MGWSALSFRRLCLGETLEMLAETGMGTLEGTGKGILAVEPRCFGELGTKSPEFSDSVRRVSKCLDLMPPRYPISIAVLVDGSQRWEPGTNKVPGSRNGTGNPVVC